MKPNASIERIREVLDYNPHNGLFTWKKRVVDINGWNKRFAGKLTGYKANMHGDFAVQICLDSKMYRANRLAWAYVYGYWSEKEIDHINLDSCDNRICNLREADRSQNECNKAVRIDNKLGVKGVHYDKARNKYQVQIKFKDARISKRYETLSEAEEAYKKLSNELHGEFGRMH